MQSSMISNVDDVASRLANAFIIDHAIATDVVNTQIQQICADASLVLGDAQELLMIVDDCFLTKIIG